MLLANSVFLLKPCSIIAFTTANIILYTEGAEMDVMMKVRLNRVDCFEK